MKIAAFLWMMCLFITTQAFAHCQIPCGIYDDEARIKMISEHIATIEKSMKSIVELSGAEQIDYNQIVRWVNNKETHANYIQEIVSGYFMSQRLVYVQPADAERYADYITRLTLLHQLGVYAMKAKQGLDLSNVQRLTELMEDFKKAYFKE